ncbi:MAG: hypothetical protein P8130_00885 [Deltaproteobacteria bacterium]
MKPLRSENRHAPAAGKPAAALAVRKAGWIIPALAIIFVLSGCGRKTAPLPPQAVVPRAINDLRYSLDEKGVELTWSYPQRSVQGERLDAIEEFEIYRAVVVPADYCADCPLPFGPPKIEPGGRILLGVSKRTATYRDSLLRPDHLYFYKVRAKGGWYYSSKDSNIVSFLWKKPLAKPENLTATAGDGMVQLAWQAPTRYLDGAPFSGPLSFRLYRAPAADKSFKVLVRDTDLTSYTDLKVVNGRQYVYTVRALQKAGTNMLPGAAARPVEATPRDLTPPPPPSGFAVRLQGQSVFLSWTIPEVKDLAGFNIYRRCGAKPRQKIATVDRNSANYTDTFPSAGLLCLYQVSAFDTAGNEGPASPEVAVGEQ